MNTELWMLAASAGLFFVQVLLAAVPRFTIKGMHWAFSPRDEEGAAMPAWAGRLQRASDNMLENLVLFAIVVLLVHAAGAENGTSALGAQVFLGARIVYIPLYAFGIPYLRTATWGIGVTGTAMVAAALLA